MALLLRNPDGTYASECSLCDKPLTEPVFATTHFIGDSSDKLFGYSDSGMHYECYAEWKYQRRFANQYFEFTRQHMAANRQWAVVADTKSFHIAANPNLSDPIAQLDLRSIGSGFRIRITDWSDWLGGGWDADCAHDLQRYAVIEVEEELRQVVPNSKSLLEMARRLIQSVSEQ